MSEPVTNRWHILTGEYPPQPGGVADYTYLVAAGMARAGAEVHVWAPAVAGDSPVSPGVAVHRDAGRWSPADLAVLGARLDAFEPPRRLLVQYTPNAWGYKGINLAFTRWLLRRRRQRGDEIWTMVHEPYYGWYLRDKPTRWLMAAAHRLMIRAVLAASTRVFLAMNALEGYLRPYEPGGRRPMIWLPVPSNVPVVDDPAGVAALRRRLAPGGGPIVGSFGTFVMLKDLVRQVLPPLLLGHPERVGLLIGRNGPGFAAALASQYPELAGRLHATGGLPPAGISRHLQACDLLVQPYDDGVSTRRGSLMAVLAHGRPIATNLGYHSEPIWAESGCVAAALTADWPAVVRVAESLLADTAARGRIAAAARTVYDRCFAVERTVAVLLGADQPAAAEPGRVTVAETPCGSTTP